jgi:hypothetical protein
MLCHSSTEWLENDQWYWRHSAAWYVMKLNSSDLSTEYDLVTQLKLWYINKSDYPQTKFVRNVDRRTYFIFLHCVF